MKPVGAPAAAAISIGVSAPVGIAQYGEEVLQPGTGGTRGSGGVGGTTTTSQQYLLKKCIAKAQAKFGDNRPKKKAAIRKCKKKYC